MLSFLSDGDKIYKANPIDEFMRGPTSSNLSTLRDLATGSLALGYCVIGGAVGAVWQETKGLALRIAGYETECVSDSRVPPFYTIRRKRD